MKKFSKLYQQAAATKGGEANLEKLIPKPKSAAALARTADDCWLAVVSTHGDCRGWSFSNGTGPTRDPY